MLTAHVSLAIDIITGICCLLQTQTCFGETQYKYRDISFPILVVSKGWKTFVKTSQTLMSATYLRATTCYHK